MARLVGCGIIIVLLLAYGGRAAADASLPRSLFPGADAADVQLRPGGWNSWQIGYNTSDAPTTWYSDVSDELEAKGWQSADDPLYGALSRTYTRLMSFGGVELRAWAHFSFDPLHPQVARILIRLSFVIPWIGKAIVPT